jgi:hypothetical protein
MTIYKINFKGMHYITDDIDVLTQNTNNKMVTTIVLGDEVTATDKLLQLRNEFYDMEISKIHIVQFIVDGDNEIWSPFNINEDSIDQSSSYIIQTNIDNEKVMVSGVELVDAVDAIKQNLLSLFKLDAYDIVTEIPNKIPNNNLLIQPNTDGMTTL